MTSNELRELYLQFFESRKHHRIASASLIPENDATVLFTTAGMHPLVPFLLGEKHPAGSRLTNCQKCIRTGDIDEVGDNRHLTFFEMLGNWSLGDYGKKQAIEYSFEFLTGKKWLNLDPRRLYVTVFAGDAKDKVAIDSEAIECWQEQFAKGGLQAQVAKNGNWENENIRIFALGKDDNWWGLASGGPCGPCTEMFYDTAPEKGFEQGKSHEQLVKDGRLIEIWNDVFMEYKKLPNGILEALPQKNVDTGMGLERTVAILNGYAEVFDIPEFKAPLHALEALSGKEYQDNQKAFRVIIDHLRAAVFILGDEKAIEPSNVEQGYVLRRLIRRAVRFGRSLSINQKFIAHIAHSFIDEYKEVYPELLKNKAFILEQLNKEEEKFAATIKNGLKIFDSLEKVTGQEAFDLYQSYGFPIELTFEELQNRKVKFNQAEIEAAFNEKMKKHQELSKAGSEQKFKGGLADTSNETASLHTATHLLQAALQRVLGPHVAQKGSNITPERLRFDFSHPDKMTPEQIKAVEDLVNEWISNDYPVKCQEMPYEQAQKLGAMGLFKDKYGDIVKLYSIGEVSREMCGGPHAVSTGKLGHFKIIKEEASSSGVRRIKAVLE